MNSAQNSSVNQSPGARRREANRIRQARHRAKLKSSGNPPAASVTAQPETVYTSFESALRYAASPFEADPAPAPRASPPESPPVSSLGLSDVLGIAMIGTAILGTAYVFVVRPLVNRILQR